MPHGAYVMLVRDQHVLVLRRQEEDHPLFKDIWDFPGGVVEAGEETWAAALRETEEETGLVVSRSELLRDWEHAWTDGETFQVTTFVGWEYEGEIRLSAEHSAYAWMAPSEVLDQDFAAHQLRSPIFVSWLDGLTTDIQLLTDRMTRSAR